MMKDRRARVDGSVSPGYDRRRRRVILPDNEKRRSRRPIESIENVHLFEKCVLENIRARISAICSNRSIRSLSLLSSLRALASSPII